MINPLHEIAEALEAEAACVWGTVEGAMAAAFASAVTGTDLAKVMEVPQLPGGLVLPRAHARDPLPYILRLTGLKPVEVGTVDACPRDELRSALGGVSGVIAVTGAACPSIADAVWTCREAGGVSVIIGRDEGWRGALDAGADLVVLDVGLPAGVVIGRTDPVAACALQARGIGRLFPADEAQLGAARVAAARFAERW